MTVFLKDPGAALDYVMDWQAGYLAGQSIIASSWAVAPEQPGGITIGADSILAGQTRVALAGGRAGRLYHVTNSVRFSDGGEDQRTLIVRVEER